MVEGLGAIVDSTVRCEEGMLEGTVGERDAHKVYIKVRNHKKLD